MRSENRAGTDIKRIMHSPGRMMRRNVERFKVVIVIFDFRPFSNIITGAGEDRFYPLYGHCNRVQPALALPSARQGNIKPTRLKPLIQGTSYQIVSLEFESLLEIFLGKINLLPGRRPLLSREFAQRL